MSYLEKLLKDVKIEWKVLGEVVDLITTGRLNANAMHDNGIYPFFTCNEKPYKINDYAFDLEAILISGNGSQVGHLNYYKGKFNAYQRTYIVGEFNGSVNVFYIFHYLNYTLRKYITKNSRKGSVPYITMPMLVNFPIPVPTLEIQKEIVRVLDKFTQLTTELTAELKSELSARNNQYSFYREQLFSFDEIEVERKALKEIGEFQRGKRFVKDDMIVEGVPCIHYGEMYTHYNIWANESKSFLSEELVENKNLRVAQKGDVVIVAAGETIEDLGKGTAWLGDEGVVIHDACFSYSSPLNPKYVAYFTRTKQFHDQIKKHISSGKISAIHSKGLGTVIIPVPPREEQERIVTILDKFDILTTSISESLPKEIELRKKQYEYYRDLLLTFPNNNIES
jgi:type I restriction enzyme S subunit